jgi:SWI/SNF-related matrix-associated actin-dependent regulator of chromatin subfamily A-like protein 1
MSEDFVSKTPESKALSILEDYEGSNNYILNLKHKKDNSKSFTPTRAQSEYIINYRNTNPKVAKKWVKLDTYFGKKLMEDKMYTKEPSEIYVEKLLVEKDKAFHIWGKIFSGETLHEFWMPKSALLKDNEVKNVSIDYEKYNHRAPMSHQKEAIEKLVRNKKFILADDMGLGKTTSTIIAALETGAKKILIVCPASLKLNWEREIANYSDRPVYIAEGKKFSNEHDFVIVNYDILKNFHDIKDKEKSEIMKINFDLVIMDEAHMISNPQAQRTKIANDIASKSERVWLLSGTPMTSRPMNYYNLLNLVDSPVAANWMAYAKRYCNGFQFSVGKRKVWNVTGASNLEELRERTQTHILRRLKEEVLDLPEKIITPVYLRLKSKDYEELMGEYFDWYDSRPEESSSLTIQFSKLMKVRKVIAQEKINNTIELAENIIEQGKKVIIFTNFTDTLNIIYNHFGKQAVYLDGSCSKFHRQNAVDEFQTNDKIKVFVGNLKAAGVGITLTSAEAVIMNDLSFVPAEHSQAEDRSHRIGQKNSTSVYYPLFENTIEGAIYDILNRKKKIISTVMGDDMMDDATTIEEMLNMISFNR